MLSSLLPSEEIGRSPPSQVTRSQWEVLTLTLKNSTENSKKCKLLVLTRKNAKLPICQTAHSRLWVQLDGVWSVIHRKCRNAKIILKLRVWSWESQSTKTDTRWQKWANRSRLQLAQYALTKRLPKPKLVWMGAHICTVTSASKLGLRTAKIHVRSAKPR